MNGGLGAATMPRGSDLNQSLSGGHDYGVEGKRWLVLIGMVLVGSMQVRKICSPRRDPRLHRRC